MKAGNMICVDGGHSKSLQLRKSSLKFPKPVVVVVVVIPYAVCVGTYLSIHR